MYSCHSQLGTIRPGENYTLPPSEPAISVINLPMEMKVSELENLLNKQLTGLLYEDNSFDDNGGDNIMAKAWKKENIRLNFDKGQFVYRVPLKLWIKVGWKIEQFGISLSDYRELNAEIALNFRTSVVINEDWTLTTTTTSEGYEWLSKPTLKLGPVDVPITWIANMVMGYNQDKINQALDEGLQKSLDLKTTARDVWKLVQEPMLLDEEYALWLRVTPKAIATTQISGGNGKLAQRTSLQVTAECFSGKKPPLRPISDLPKLSKGLSTGNDFLMNVNAYVPFAYIDSVTRKELQGSRYDIGKRYIVIKGCEVYGSEQQMIIAAQVEGSLNGTLYFAGNPAYRPSDSSIVLNNLQFHMQTRNVLLRSAAWLANGGIERLIQRKMAYPAGPSINETYKAINQSLAKYPLAEGFLLSGRLGAIEVQQPLLAPGGVIAPVLLKGTAQIIYQEKP